MGEVESDDGERPPPVTGGETEAHGIWLPGDVVAFDPLLMCLQGATGQGQGWGKWGI